MSQCTHKATGSDASGSNAKTKSPAESGQPCLLLLCSVIGVEIMPFVAIFACGF